MLFADGSRLDVDMLVISAGIKPRDEVARAVGLEVGVRGGIIVNDALQTSDPNIFAIGECALAHQMIYGLVAPGFEMADVVATNLSGGHKIFKPYDMSTKLKLIGVDVASFGDAFIQEPNAQTIVFENSAKGIEELFGKSWDDGGKVKGFKKGVLPLLGYFISHESHHRGNILLILYLLSAWYCQCFIIRPSF